MNTTELPVRPDVAAFVTRVRELLVDLSEEDRLELTEGLEADLTDQVAELGAGALDDPEAYASELRAAAGFEPVARRRVRRGRPMSASEVLDDVRSRWEALVAHPRVAPGWRVLVALRPAWWVLRAWAAAVVLARLVPGWYPYGLTWLPGVHAAVGLGLLVACIVGSALVGLGKVWPGSASGVLARTTLLLLNLAAVIALPVINGQLDRLSWDRYSQGYNEARWTGNSEGLVNGGRQVCNIAADDADGRPLTGVQLFDQEGRPLDVRCWDQRATTVPWVLGDVTRWNVFPLGERDRPARTERRREDLTGAAFPTPDRATAPEVTNPLVPEPAERERISPDDRGAADGANAGEKGGTDDGRRDRRDVSRR
jgi:hypothetical protein